MVMRLSDILPGEGAQVLAVAAGSSIRRRLFDLGLVEGTQVKCLMKSPLGDPTAYLIKDTVIALRKEDAAGITVEKRL